MAIFDGEGQRVVVRVVYDGPAFAGKTTNVRRLYGFFTARRRSELYVPAERAGRTLYFDWMHLDGGLVGGYPLRAQLVTVPGQDELSHRRALLLDGADVVVFVCDARPDGLREAAPMLASLRRHLGRRGAPALLVVQANKQDLPGALDITAVAASLGLAGGEPVVGARAEDGAGVRETAVVAIRLAAAAVQRALLQSGVAALLGRAQSGEALYAAMVRAESPAAPPPALEAPPPAFDPEDGPPEVDLSAMLEARDEPAPAASAATPAHTAVVYPHSQPASDRPCLPSERAGVAPDPPVALAPVAPATPVALAPPAWPLSPPAEPPLPRPDEPLGFIWPAATGRDVLRRLEGAGPPFRHEGLAGSRGTDDGSASPSALVYEVGLWCAKTSPRRRYLDLDDARAALLRLARRKTLLGRFLPRRTVLSLRDDGRGGYWLWTISPWLATARALMNHARDHGDDERLGEALGLYARAAVEAAALALRQGVVLDVHPSNFGVLGRDAYYLDDDVAEGEALPELGHALLQRVEEYGARPAAVGRYLDAFEAAVRERLAPGEVRQVGLLAGLDAFRTRSDVGARARARARDFLQTFVGDAVELDGVASARPA